MFLSRLHILNKETSHLLPTSKFAFISRLDSAGKFVRCSPTMKILSLSLLSLVLGFTQVQVQAQDAAEKSLKVGDPAPALSSGKFVQGEAVKEFNKDNAYIVEFWATWCGPCRATIPHLNELHTKFKDKGLVVIGQNVWERDEKLVEPFIKEMGDKMTYRLALDDKSSEEKGAMAKNWMTAAGQNGIPSAFIVGKDSKIAWIGHPSQLNDAMIQEVLDGKFDTSAAAKKIEEETKKKTAMGTVQTTMAKAIREKDWPTAEKAVAEFSEMLEPERRKFLDMPRLQILLGQKKTEDASKMAEKLRSENEDNTMIQYQIASIFSSVPAEDKPDLAFAEKCARQALDKSEGGNKAPCQALLAKVLFLKGSKEEAVKLQEQAVESAPAQFKARFQKTLDSYKEGKLPSTEKL